MLHPDSLVGSYVVLQISAKAMVAGYGDSPIWAVAKALGTKQYVALVEKEVQVPTSSYGPLWRVYRVSFVGPHVHSRRPNHPNECIPILPTTSEEMSASIFKPSQPFPVADCCHRPPIDAFIRVHRYSQHEEPLWTLSEEQLRRLVVSRKAAMNHATAETYLPSIRSDATSLTFRSPASLPRDETNYFFARLERPHTPLPFSQNDNYPEHRASPSLSLSTLADLALTPAPSTPTMHDFPSLRQTTRITTPSSDCTATSVSALFEHARPRRHDTLETASVYSNTDTPRSSIALHPESPSTSKLVLGSEIDMDEIPLVDLSFDVAALNAVPEPSGFAEERAVVIQLVQKAKERHQGALAERLRGPAEPDAKSERSRRLSLVNVRSHQSADTYPSSSYGRSPRKLRRARSHVSTQRNASVAQFEKLQEPKRIEEVAVSAAGPELTVVSTSKKTPTSKRSPSKLCKLLRSFAVRLGLRAGIQKKHRRTGRSGSRPPSRQSHRAAGPGGSQ